MDAFRLREKVVADYAEYVQGFLAILDPRIRAVVDERLADGFPHNVSHLRRGSMRQVRATLQAYSNE